MPNSPLTLSPAIGRMEPPGPSSLELLKLLPGIQTDPLGFIGTAVRTYGDLVRLQAGPYTAFLVNHPDNIKHVLMDNAHNYTKRTFQYQALAAVTGQGLLTSDGDFWFSQRRLLQPAFSRPKLAGFTALMADSTRKMLARWDVLADTGAVVDIEQEMLNLALEILGRSFFDADLSQEAPLLTGAAKVALDTIMARTRSVVNLPGFIPTRQNRRFNQALRDLDKAVADLVEGQRAKGGEGSSLLSHLVQVVDTSADRALALRQVCDELITLLIAGHETVASGLTWSCYLLAQNPQIARDLTAESQAVLGDAWPEADTLDKLGLSRRIFDETLRLYPPAWLITRRALAADQIGGCRIPPGAFMIIGVHAVHRHPDFWPDAERFDPARFTDDASAGRPRFAYLPFGGGPRLCIGNSFALAEAQVILSLIFSLFRLDLATQNPVETEALVTLRPRHGLPMTIHRL